MADEHIDVTYPKPENDPMQHRFYHKECDGVILGKEYDKCMDGAKIVIEARTGITPKKSNISIPDFE